VNERFLKSDLKKCTFHLKLEPDSSGMKMSWNHMCIEWDPWQILNFDQSIQNSQNEMPNVKGYKNLKNMMLITSIIFLFWVFSFLIFYLKGYSSYILTFRDHKHFKYIFIQSILYRMKSQGAMRDWSRCFSTLEIQNFLISRGSLVFFVS
jgi:hypothetical protein